MTVKIPTEAQMAKLPVWALDMIKVLKMRLDEAKDEITLLKGNTPSLVNDEGWNIHEMDRLRPLGDHARISFKLPKKNDKIYVSLIRSNKEEGIRVSGYNGKLSINPVASNVVEITTES